MMLQPFPANQIKTAPLTRAGQMKRILSNRQILNILLICSACSDTPVLQCVSSYPTYWISLSDSVISIFKMVTRNIIKKVQAVTVLQCKARCTLKCQMENNTNTTIESMTLTFWIHDVIRSMIPESNGFGAEQIAFCWNVAGDANGNYLLTSTFPHSSSPLSHPILLLS